MQHTIPVVITISGIDPSGGAGIQADIEALASMGCHAAPIVTALTVQDTRRVIDYQSVDHGLLARQIRTVLEDLSVSACKIGMVGNAETAEMIQGILVEYPDIPVVLDPVLLAGGGGELSDSGTEAALIERLIPLATVLTPNGTEARRLAPGADSLHDCARELLARGAEYVLITGADEATPHVANTLHSHNRVSEVFSWERLPGSYHGSGCTLAAAIAGLLAHGTEPRNAIREAQQYTWETLKQGYRVGKGQQIPNRLFWALYDTGV